MKVLPLFVVALAGVAASAGLFAQPTDKEMQEQMAAHRQAAEPGPVHATLGKRGGTYTSKTTFKMPGMPKDAQAMETTGEATIRPVLGGRFLMQEETGEMMGEKYTTIKQWGYNNGSKEFESVWTYTGSTAMMVMKGTSADNGKTVTYTSEVADGAKSEKFRIVTKQVNDDSFTVELIGIEGDGKEGATMVTTYTRKK